MQGVLRCDCPPNPVLAEIREGRIFVKRRRFFLFTDGPALIKCDNCNQWHEIVYNGAMIKKTPEEVASKIGYQCVNCGYSFHPDGVRESCPKCGAVQMTAKTKIKQTR